MGKRSVPPLDISLFGTHVLGMAGKVIEEGDVVRFRGSSEDEGRQSLYRVIEVEGDELIIELICGRPMAPQATVRMGEVELAEEDE